MNTYFGPSSSTALECRSNALENITSCCTHKKKMQNQVRFKPVKDLFIHFMITLIFPCVLYVTNSSLTLIFCTFYFQCHYNDQTKEFSVQDYGILLEENRQQYALIKSTTVILCNKHLITRIIFLVNSEVAESSVHEI